MTIRRILFSIIALAAPIAALAAARSGDVPELLVRVKGTLNLVIAVLLVIATLVFIWGVILFITSAGDPSKHADGRQYMIWGIVALAVIAAAWAVANVIIAYFFGVDASNTKSIQKIENITPIPKEPTLR